MELLDIDIRLIFAIMNGKVSSAINRKLQKNFSAADVNLTPEQWTVMLYLRSKTASHSNSSATQSIKTSPR